MAFPLYDNEGKIADGYYGIDPYHDPSWFSGRDTPERRVDSEDSIRALYRRHKRRDADIECEYCGGRFRTKGVDKAVNWFHTHDCAPLEAAEARGIVLSMKPLTDASKAKAA